LKAGDPKPQSTKEIPRPLERRYPGIPEAEEARKKLTEIISK